MTAGHRDAPRSCVICEWVAPPGGPRDPASPGRRPNCQRVSLLSGQERCASPVALLIFLNDAAVIDDCTTLADLETDR
jgi:hypothetical protein